MRNSAQPSAETAHPASARRIVVVDDDPMLRDAFVCMLEDAGFLTESYESAEALLRANWAQHADCLLLDAGLPGISGLELLKRLADSGNRVPVVMITGSGDVRKAVRAMKDGAADFIEKPTSESDIIATIERAIGKQMGGANLETLQLEANRFIAGLTARQTEVLFRVVDGQPSKNIAADLGISQRTVENHRAVIMRKSGVKSLPALARIVFAASLSPRPPSSDSPEGSAGTPFATAGVAGERDGDQFGRYFDQIPLAVVISAIAEPERVVYANPAFEELSGQSRAAVTGQSWSSVPGVSLNLEPRIPLGDAVLKSSDLIGTFQIDRPDRSTVTVEVFSNVIVNVDDGPTFRLAALVDVSNRDNEKLQEFETLIREKDMRLLEIQHRVKNNLQMITALVRVEARKAQGRSEPGSFHRLAGRINSIQLIYKLLSESGQGNEIDLGVYLSEIASSIMHSSAIEGIRLELKVDSYPVSVNVALPTGLVVNELLTNSLKHAFADREGGTITLQSLTDQHGCSVVIADDGIGLPPEVSWPSHGKLSALIVQSLRENAKADIIVDSKAGNGMRVTINFPREARESLTSAGSVSLTTPRRHHPAAQ